MAENWWEADEVVDNGKKGDPQRSFELTRASLEDLRSLKARVNPTNSGFLGSMQAPDERRMFFKSGIGGTPGFNLDSDLDTVRGRNMLSELMNMKAASPTGASGLGALNQTEGDTLRATIGNLNVRQSPDQLRKNMSRAEELLKRLTPGVTEEVPIDLSGGESRSTIPQRAFYKDPWGNIRRNDNGDKGNPKVFDKTKPIAQQVSAVVKKKQLHQKYGLED